MTPFWRTLGRRAARQDWAAWLLSLFLLAVGLAFVYSASWRGEETGIVGAWFPKQVEWAAIGTGVALLLALTNYHVWIRHAWWLYGASILLLALTPVVGRKFYGAYRWIVLFGVQVQPSEFAKVALVLVLARVLANPAVEPRSFALALGVAGIAAVPFALILAEPDLGTALTILPTALAMLWVAGLKWRWLAVGAASAAAAAPLAWYFVMDGYQKERVMVFLDPSRDPLNSGWNALQSAIAVGSGGLWGKGYLQGTQNVLGFLPRTVSPSDFIFPVIAEEKGFVGSAVLLGAFAILLACYLRAAARAPDPQGGLLATGLAALLFCHVFVNIGMTIGLLPITGLPLPFISSGGSFMLGTMAAFGLVQSVYAHRQPRETL